MVLAACTAPTPRPSAEAIPTASLGTGESDPEPRTEAPASVAGDHSTAPATTGVSPPPTVEVGTALIGGIASWYRYNPGEAAAGPALRDALGKSWRGTRLRVCHREACVRVTLTDFMANHGALIDLSIEDFRKLAAPSVGLIEVQVELP